MKMRPNKIQRQIPLISTILIALVFYIKLTLFHCHSFRRDDEQLFSFGLLSVWEIFHHEWIFPTTWKLKTKFTHRATLFQHVCFWPTIIMWFVISFDVERIAYTYYRHYSALFPFFKWQHNSFSMCIPNILYEMLYKLVRDAQYLQSYFNYIPFIRNLIEYSESYIMRWNLQHQLSIPRPKNVPKLWSTGLNL